MLIPLAVRSESAINNFHLLRPRCCCLYLLSCFYQIKVQSRCPGHTPQLFGLSVPDKELVDFISWLVVNEREEGVVVYPLSLKKTPTLLEPILWGFENVNIIEKIYIQFLRYLALARKSTPMYVLW